MYVKYLKQAMVSKITWKYLRKKRARVLTRFRVSSHKLQRQEDELTEIETGVCLPFVRQTALAINSQSPSHSTDIYLLRYSYFRPNTLKTREIFSTINKQLLKNLASCTDKGFISFQIF